jgi:hypothetical protein
VVPLGFIIAQITHFEFTKHTIVGSTYLYTVVVSIGLPGIITLLQFSQLAPQLLADRYSYKFINLPGSYTLVFAALCVEKIGFTSVTSLLYKLIETCFNFNEDEEEKIETVAHNEAFEINKNSIEV